MKIAATSIYPGPSIYSRHPVVHFTLAEVPPAIRRKLPASAIRALGERLPGLRTPPPSSDAPALATCDDLGRLASLDHLFEHVCIELQNLAGAGLMCLRSQSYRGSEYSGAAVPYEEADLCVAAGRLACELIASVSAADAPAAEFTERIEEFVKRATASMLPAQDRALARAARALDIPVTRLVGRVLVLGQGRYQRRLSATKTSLTSVVSNDLAANKDYSRRVLSDLGLPVPRYERVYRASSAVAAARRIGYPVVVKPNNSSMGTAVSVGMKNRREVIAAYRRAKAIDRSVLVEELVEGADFRMLVIDGKLRAAAKRIPAHVIGDGARTIDELVTAANSDPRRGSGPTRPWSRLELDDQADRLLADVGYTRSGVPPAGEIVYLRRNANTSSGGTAIDVTDEVHPDNRDIAERAARAVGLDIAGVDILTPDISASMRKTGGRICEINSRPGIRKHLWPASGKARDVLTPIIDMLFPSGRPSRVPVAIVTGTGNTGTTARMLAHILTTGGHHVGLLANGRVYVGGRRIGRGRLTPSAAGRMILLDPDVDAAVFEIAPGEVLRHGLACDAANVVAVVGSGAPSRNNSGDHPPPSEMIEAIRAVTRIGRQVVYVDATDPFAPAVVQDTGTAELCPIAVGAAAARVAGPFSQNGRLALLEGDSITMRAGGRVKERMPMAELTGVIPDVDLATATQCALYAAVCAHAMGIRPGEIYRGLRSFAPTAGQPGKRRGEKNTKADMAPETDARQH